MMDEHGMLISFGRSHGDRGFSTRATIFIIIPQSAIPDNSRIRFREKTSIYVTIDVHEKCNKCIWSSYRWYSC